MSTTIDIKQAIILANGKFPQRKEVVDILKKADHIICCDGAVNKLEESGIEPYAIIGDLDSLSVEAKEKYIDRIHLWEDQNMNDLTKAVKWAIKNEFNQILILGATGEREDHTIGNFYLLTEYSKWVDIQMITDYGRVIPINKTTTLQSTKGQQISVFTSDPGTLITYKGLKYPVTRQTFSMPWMGTLNEANGDQFTIETDREGVLVYLLF